MKLTSERLAYASPVVGLIGDEVALLYCGGSLLVGLSLLSGWDTTQRWPLKVEMGLISLDHFGRLAFVS